MGHVICVSRIPDKGLLKFSLSKVGNIKSKLERDPATGWLNLSNRVFFKQIERVRWMPHCWRHRMLNILAEPWCALVYNLFSDLGYNANKTIKSMEIVWVGQGLDLICIPLRQEAACQVNPTSQRTELAWISNSKLLLVFKLHPNVFWQLCKLQGAAKSDWNVGVRRNIPK